MLSSSRVGRKTGTGRRRKPLGPCSRTTSYLVCVAKLKETLSRGLPSVSATSHRWRPLWRRASRPSPSGRMTFTSFSPMARCSIDLVFLASRRGSASAPMTAYGSASRWLLPTPFSPRRTLRPSLKVRFASANAVKFLMCSDRSKKDDLLSAL